MKLLESFAILKEVNPIWYFNLYPENVRSFSTYYYNSSVIKIPDEYNELITEEKIKETRRLVNKGEPQGEVIEKLKAEGYSEEDISKIFVAHSYDMRSWHLVFAIVFLLLAFYLFVVRKSLLMFVFAGLMFWMYYKEVERLKREEARRSKQ